MEPYYERLQDEIDFGIPTKAKTERKKTNMNDLQITIIQAQIKSNFEEIRA